MNKHTLNAYLTYSEPPILKLPELGLEVSGKQTSAPMCRLIMSVFPTYAESQLNVYHGEKLVFTVANVAVMATKAIHENGSGINMAKYNPFDRSVFG